MTPNVLEAVRRFRIDPLKSGPWIDMSEAKPDGSLVPDVRDMNLPFSKFACCSRDATGDIHAFTVHSLLDIRGPLVLHRHFVGSKAGDVATMRFTVELLDDQSNKVSILFWANNDGLNVNGDEIVDGHPRYFRWFNDLRCEIHEACTMLKSAAPTTTKPVQLCPRPPNARGKSTGYEWRVIEIEPSAPKSEPRGGTHASPRAHERRGHWVKRGDKQFWRRSCVVGDAKDGFIFHTYKAKDQPHAH